MQAPTKAFALAGVCTLGIGFGFVENCIPKERGLYDTMGVR
jgi:hypothetical protein